MKRNFYLGNSVVIFNRIAFFLFFSILISLSAPVFATQYFVALDGNDANTGSISSPFKTIQRGQTAAVAGDTVYVRGGTYTMDTTQIAATSGTLFAYVTNLNKSGTAGKRINYWAYPGEKPVFDYINVKPVGRRVNAFEVSGSYIHIKGLEVIGVQVTITDANTQSICFDNTGSYNIYEQLSMHDGQGIGYYSTRGRNNLVLNCDAYRNNDFTSRAGGGINGGNVDGFGNHVTSAGDTNNVFKGCRAWFNSDDGYDCITADEATIFDSCWAFYNGFAVGFVTRGDGNGFKAGGYGSTVFTSLPTNIPRNTIRFCLSVRNRSAGFYSNHHLSGSDWYNNTAYLNPTNYNMLNRKAKTSADYLTDVPGYNHVIKNNISVSAGAGGNISNYDAATCIITNNTFLNTGVTVSTNDFLSIDENLLTAPRQADGSLPKNDFMRLKPTSALIDKGVDIGFPFNGAAPDLGCFETAAILPVELISFTATAVGKKVELQWKIATETQNKGWQVERATVINGASAAWQTIAFVAGKGNSTQLATYLYTDDNVSAGSYTYRLKQIDFDGNFKYSNIQSVKILNTVSASLSVYPTLVSSNATIVYTVPSKAAVGLALYNSFGQLVATIFNGIQDEGTYQKQLNETLLTASGTYFLKLSVDGKVITTSFVKAK